MPDRRRSLVTSEASIRVAKAVAAIVAFCGTLLGIIFVLWPSLKPEGPSPTRRVALSELTLERPVTFGAYMRRINQPSGGLERAVLERRGALVSFHFVIEGYKDRALPVAWQLIDARSGEPIDANKDIRLTPEARKDSGTWPVWVPLPSGRPRHVFIEIQLFEPRGVVAVRTLRTKEFPSRE
jgi:hypothetical protein